MLPTYYLYFNCSKFTKKAHELKMNKKKSRETRAEKVILAHEECKTRSMRDTRAREVGEHVEHKSHETRGT